MKILVGIKHVPDTETPVKISQEGNSLDPAAVSKWIISPYDEFALEQALRFREASGGEVVLVCAGPAEAQATLRQGLAMGADRAVLVEDAALDDADGLTRARLLAAVAGEVAPDLILVGKYGVGTDEGLTGPMLGELLGWPHASAVSKLELKGDGSFEVERAVEGGVEVQEGSLPAVVSCDKSLNEPRYPSLKGIMQAKKKPIERKSVGDLGIETHRRVVWESLELPPERSTGRLIDGSPEDAARELVRILHEEAKVI